MQKWLLFVLSVNKEAYILPKDLELLKELELEMFRSYGIRRRIETAESIRETWFTTSNCYALDSSNNVVALNLFGAKLVSIPKQVFQLKHLRSLFLWNNDISNIPDSIRGLQDLESIFLVDNKLNTFPKALHHFQQLHRA